MNTMHSHGVSYGSRAPLGAGAIWALMRRPQIQLRTGQTVHRRTLSSAVPFIISVHAVLCMSTIPCRKVCAVVCCIY